MSRPEMDQEPLTPEVLAKDTDLKAAVEALLDPDSRAEIVRDLERSREKLRLSIERNDHPKIKAYWEGRIRAIQIGLENTSDRFIA